MFGIGLLANVVFGIVDKLNAKLDPYDDFTRIFLPPDPQKSLHEKATELTLNLLENFKLANGLFLYNRFRDGEDPDFGDQAVHHGLAAAALGFGVSTGDVLPENAEQAAKAIGLLFDNGRLVRGRDPRDDTKFADDASNDSASGALCGIYFSAKYGGTKAGVAGIDNIRMLADELIANNFALIGPDKKPTTYGKLINGMLTDPSRSSVCLGIIRAAHIMTGDPKYRTVFDDLYKKYGTLPRFAEFKFLDYTKTYDAHRCAIHLHILADLAQGNAELAERCSDGLRRIWSLHRKTRDPWIAALVNRFWRIPDAEMRDVVHRLHEYPVAGKPPMRDTINSAKTDYWTPRGVRFFKVEGNMRSSQPLPYWALPTQDFWPQRHPFMCDGYAGVNWETMVRHNPVDFLAPYYLLRTQGVIKADE